MKIITTKTLWFTDDERACLAKALSLFNGEVTVKKIWSLDKGYGIEASLESTDIVRYDKPIPDYGDVMDVQLYKESVSSGLFVDSDGHGRPVKDGLVGNMTLCPSQVDFLPEDATHVVWFNK